METGVQNTFIPHDVSQPAEAGRRHENTLMDLVALVSIVLLVASVALAAGVFLYEQYLDTSSKSKVNQLKIAKAQFDPLLIQEFSRLDDRMRDADLVLGSHIAPSVFFHMLEANTLSTVSFRSLEFQASSDEGMAIKMQGIARSVNSIALQADFFSKVGIITSPIFSDIDRQSDGVHFSFSALVNPAAIRYAQLVTASGNAAGSIAPIPAAPAFAPSPASSTPSASPAPAAVQPSGFFPSQPAKQP
ncbi:MAG: hypothetical protein Q8Q13_03015 [bacterium]|nr:hypothetical protein [bacterium]